MGCKGRITATEVWMLNVSQDGGIDRYDDLHIDGIDPEWKPREAWVSGGLFAFQEAVKSRDRLKPSLTVALGLSLIPEAFVWREIGGLAQLRPQLDWTPPPCISFVEKKNPAPISTRQFEMVWWPQTPRR
jgi:hypothetical protein